MAISQSRLSAAVLLLASLCTQAAHGFAVFGYVPEYRFHSLDWDGVVAQTTHIILFSLEPQATGELAHLDRLKFVMRQNSQGLLGALQRAPTKPKVLFSLGGSGRSQNFAELAGISKRRKLLARSLVAILRENPALQGFDLDWEAPTSAAQWRDFGKVAREIRDAFDEADDLPQGRPILTMAYHPLSGAVQAFSGLTSKGTGRTFADLFDYCHTMTYSQFDAEQRHSSMQLVELAIQEWKHANLPISKLTLGLPFFGVTRNSGETPRAASWGDMLDKDPSLKDRLADDETEDQIWFNNAETLRKKVRYAADTGLAGVMIWELGQDKPASHKTAGSLLRHVYEEASNIPGFAPGILGVILGMLILNETNVFAVGAAAVGVYLLFLVFTRSPPGHKFAKARKLPPLSEEELCPPGKDAVDGATGLDSTDQEEPANGTEEEMPTADDDGEDGPRKRGSPAADS